ncbi:MAG: Asp-tRNA(Asn)/Glu-tRNA(Gln) amidotransferase subunit GatC [Pseudomonadota bacterium]
MNITEEEVLRVADLARLELKKDAVLRLCEQIGEVLRYIELLNQADTTHVLPTSHAIVLTNILREDKVGKHLSRKLALSNAPEKDDGNFIVPKIIKT